MVLCSDNGKTYSVDLRSNVGMLMDAWKEVTQDKLRNCFWHVGFTLGTEIEIIDSMPDQPPSMNIVIDDPGAAGVSLPTEIIFGTIR